MIYARANTMWKNKRSDDVDVQQMVGVDVAISSKRCARRSFSILYSGRKIESARGEARIEDF